jgi:hypothetical protein
MSGWFFRLLFLKIERFLIFSQRECPIHFGEFPVSTALPRRFCKNYQTSVLFRLSSIDFHLRLHRRYSAYAEINVAGGNHCSGPRVSLLDCVRNRVSQLSVALRKGRDRDVACIHRAGYPDCIGNSGRGVVRLASVAPPRATWRSPATTHYCRKTGRRGCSQSGKN